MRLFVDDERSPPGDGYIISRTAAGAIEALAWAHSTAQDLRILSLDHDLGENGPTGYDVASWLEKEVFLNSEHRSVLQTQRDGNTKD